MLLSSTLIRPKSSRWVFTHNNYEEDDCSVILAFFRVECKYGIYGREVGASGTPHLQGFFILNTSGSRTLAWVRDKFPIANVHFEIARGSSKQAADYCKKEGNFVEHGAPSEPGRRNDLHDAFEWGREFLQQYGRPPTSPEIVASEHFTVYIKNPRFRSALLKLAPVKKRLEFAGLRDWQIPLHEELTAGADDRKVIFYVDSVGGAGKSFFCRYMLEHHEEDVQVFGAGKEQDLAYMVDEFKSIYLFDISRSRLEYLQYSILEQLKNGMVQSTKYMSMVKRLPRLAHVVVFCNENPDLTKLSEDRYDIRSI